MAGLRERKKQKTAAAIHEAGLRLFREHGYHSVTIADIAEAAEVSRATVFAYYGAKEDIVWGESAAAVDSLRNALDARPPDTPVVHAARAWLQRLAGWLEPDIVLQLRLADEVPAVSAARARIVSQIEVALAEAIVDDDLPESRLSPRLVAGALTSALEAVEREAACRMTRGEAPPDDGEIDALFDTALAFIDGGLANVRDMGGE